MPQLLDQNFCRTVVLLCKHSDEGAFGLVVNRPLLTTERDLEVWVGGPVEPERSWILVGGDEYNDLPVVRGRRRFIAVDDRPICCGVCSSPTRRRTRG